MISFLRGTLVTALPTRIVVEVHGVGYQLDIPLSSYDRLPACGQEFQVLTRLVVREDSQTLYGFMSDAERDLFDLLVSHVSGVGPKVALGILSGLPVDRFKSAVVASDVDQLARIKGLGRKTAERIVVELKDRIGVAAAWETSDKQIPGVDREANDAVLALISLGYKQVDAWKAVRNAREKNAGAESSEELVRLALRALAA